MLCIFFLVLGTTNRREQEKNEMILYIFAISLVLYSTFFFMWNKRGDKKKFMSDFLLQNFSM